MRVKGNFGLAGSIVDGVTKICGEYGRVNCAGR